MLEHSTSISVSEHSTLPSPTTDLTAIISAATFANVDNESPPQLDQLANMRRQTEKLAREQTLYRKKSDLWIDWEDVQRTRVAVVAAYNAAPAAMRPAILREVLLIMFHSVTPPDRVGTRPQPRDHLLPCTLPHCASCPFTTIPSHVLRGHPPSASQPQSLP